MSVLSDRVFECWRPRPRVKATEWIPRHVRISNGDPLSLHQFPHMRGPLEELDNPRRREVVLCWATRMGKTTLGYAYSLFTAECNPQRQLYASSTQKLAVEAVRDELYPMAERCGPLAGQLKPKARRSSARVEFRASHIRVAWSGSVSSLGGFKAWFAHLSETDKWSSDASDEADPVELAKERTKEFPDARIFIEGTPTIKGRSRLERALAESTDCRYHVPCPHCGEFQELKMAGIVWDKPEGSEHSDPDLAVRTARYRCCHCAAEIGDEARPAMMRAGVWVPSGQAVSREGQLEGTPRRDGDVAGYQISSLYSLNLTWGVIAAKFLRAGKHPRLLQNFINSWLGLSWELHRAKTSAEQLGERLHTAVPRGIVPEWARFITIGVDKQGAEGGFMPFAVVAHGESERAALIEYGVAESWAELQREVIDLGYPHEDGGPQVRTSLTVIDSGFATKDVYDFCRGRTGVIPVKGMDTHSVEPYRITRVGETATAKRLGNTGQGQVLLLVNTDFWESEVQVRLEDRRPTEPGGLALCAGAERDEELLEQLLNAAQADKVDSRGAAKLLWVKKSPEVPNDFRDCLRYALCAAKAFLDDRVGRMPLRGTAVPPAKSVVNAGAERPDGRPWIPQR